MFGWLGAISTVVGLTGWPDDLKGWNTIIEENFFAFRLVLSLVGLGIFYAAFQDRIKLLVFGESRELGNLKKEVETLKVSQSHTEAEGVESKLVIHSAIYGALGEYRDVTPQVQEHVADDSLDILVHAGTMKCDPSHNKPKFLWVNYSFAAKTIHRTLIPEGERLKLNDSRIPEDPEIWEMDQEQHKFLETQARFVTIKALLSKLAIREVGSTS